MELFRDVLDSRLVDRQGRAAGRVDGIVAEVRDGKPPVVTALESGVPELIRRVNLRAGGWVEAIGRRWGLRGGEVYRVSISKVRDVGMDIDLDLDARDTPLFAWERWLRERVISRIPGSGA